MKPSSIALASFALKLDKAACVVFSDIVFEGSADKETMVAKACPSFLLIVARAQLNKASVMVSTFAWQRLKSAPCSARSRAEQDVVILARPALSRLCTSSRGLEGKQR